ncbi:MAG TPA: histidine--tRNA ligase [Pyrinomonadaceae bacterium]|nr:histidine--tRNA ligase [Pyrinomonadaceae bacterium]
MSSAKTQPARGMRDFLPADVRKREYVIGVIKSVYERYGFEPLETPAVENIETLMGKYGEEGNQLIFKILKRGEHEKTAEADLALRYDLTVPLARVVAQYQNELPKFFKRYQIQPVWRADRPARGRFREFYQCDVDVLGSRSMVVEAELIAAASDALVALGFNDFTIRLNHRQLIDAMMVASMIEPDKRASVLVTIDKLDKIGIEGVERELRILGLSEDNIRPLLNRMTKKTFIDPSFKVHEFSQDNYEANTEHLGFIFNSFKDFPYDHEAKTLGSKAVGELSEIIDLARSASANKHIKIDPSLARGLSYYTGTIMEISVSDLSGSLGGGGRYDNLVGMFLGKDIPACGFSLGLERIIVVMSEREMFPALLITSPADVMVLIWYEKDKAEKIEAAKTSLSLAQELRASGLRVDVYPVRNVKVSTQIAYAAKRQFPFVAFIGEDERQTDLVSIKDLRTGEQSSLSRVRAIELIKAAVKKHHVENSPQ